jgi:PAS domain S-box-containing protein
MQNTPQKSSENNFLALLNFIVDPAVIVDEKGHILLVNNAFEDSTGLSAKEVIGQVFLEVSILPAESKAIMLENLKKRMQGLPIQPYEITFTNKNGELAYIEIKAKKISYSGQSADLVIFRDITRRKRNLAKLKEYSEKMEILVNEKIKEVKESAQKLSVSEEKYRKQFEEALDAIFVADAETGILVDCNRAASELVGREKSELIGKNQRILHPSKEIEGDFSRTFKQHIEEKEGQILEAQVITKRGEIKDVAIKANVFEVRGKKMLQGIFRDITERKKMEAEVKQKLDMLEALTQNLGVGFTIISKDYHVLWANKFIKNNVGEVEGKQCYSSLNTLDHICPDCGVRKVFEEGVAKDSHEYTNIGIHGKPYYVELIATPLKDKDGNVTAALEFVVDIAEKKHMQSKLTEYSQKLEKLVDERTEQLNQTQIKLLKAEKLAAIGELAGMIGHDLRNPLTGIKGAAYYLKTKCAAEIGATGKEMLKTIDKAIDYSNKIINDLLEYSSKLSLELTETTPKLLLKNTLTLIEVPERTQIIDATKNKPKIKADIGNMSKVFANIITNAIDAMPGAGTLTITSKTAKGKVKIIFKDTGIGMTEETLSKLKLGFPLFTTKAKGMGFGLPICKRIVEAHGGKISLKSMLGKGTAVTVTIPVNPKLMDEGEPKWFFTESTLQAMHISQKTPRKP